MPGSSGARNRRLFWIAASSMAMILAIAGILVERQYAAARIVEAKHDWMLVLELRRSALRTYMDTASAEVLFWAEDPAIQKAFMDFAESWVALGDNVTEYLRDLYIAGSQPSQTADLDRSGYRTIHDGFHPRARRFVDVRGYYDVFFIDLVGNVIYSAEKENDFATNLISGPWQDSGLADAFLRARNNPNRDFIAVSDLERYDPSAGAPAIFAAAPMITADGEPLGVLALQLPIDRIRAIMQFTAGMGETGETYLVGEDLLMRSDSRFLGTSTILDTVVDTPSVAGALAGESGVEFIDDYRDIAVLSAYGPFEIDGRRWAVLAEIDRAEILAPLTVARQWIVSACLLAFLMGVGTLWYLRDRGGGKG